MFLKERKSAVILIFLPWDYLLILLDFLVFIQILQYKRLPLLLDTSSHLYFFSNGWKKFCPLQLERAITLLSSASNVYQFLLYYWVTQSLTKGSKTDDPLPLCSCPPPIHFDQSLNVAHKTKVRIRFSLNVKRSQMDPSFDLS